MKKTLLLGGTALLTILTLLCGCDKKGKRGMGMEGETPVVDVAYPTVDSVTLHRTFPGTLTPNAKADVVARVNGQILSKNYQDGDYVTKGQTLYVIESTKYRDAVQQAQSALRTARSQYDYASRQYEAMKKALEADAVAEITVVQAKSSMEEAQASIRNAEAALQTASTNLGYCTVRAPISGHIASANYNVGAYVNGEGSPAVMSTVYDDTSLSVEFAIEENQYETLMNAGDPAMQAMYRKVPLVFKEPLSHTYTADINYSSPAVDTSTGTVTVKGRVSNDQKELRTGMYVTVSLPYGTSPHAVLIPDACIGTDQLGRYIYAVNDSDRVVYTPVKVGDLYRDSLRIIESGANAKTRYVTKALLTVRNGEPVKPRLVK